MKEKSRAVKRINRYTAAIFLGAMIFCMCMNLTGSVLSDIMTSYQMNLDNGGLMTLFQYGGGIAAVLLVSLFADRSNKKPVFLILAFGLMGGMLFCIGAFPPFAVFMACYMLLGAGMCIVDVMNNAILSDLHKEKRNTALCIHHGVSGFGAGFIPILTVLVGTGNWRITYRIVAGIIGIVIVLHLVTYLVGKKEIDEAAPVARKMADQVSRKCFFQDRRVWISALSMFTFGACQGGTTVWCVKYCRETFPQMSALGCALSLSAYWIGAMISRLAAGLLPVMRKWDSRKLIIWGGILGAVAEFLGLLSGNYYGVVLGIFAMGMLNGMTLPGNVALMTGWYPQLSGLASAVSFISLYLGFALIPLLMGFVGSICGMSVMMMVPVTGTFLSGLLGFALPPKNRAKKKSETL